MGQYRGANIVKDGLVLNLDAGSQRSFRNFSDSVEVLIVAGGGGGGVGSNGGGGGGAGGVIYLESYSPSSIADTTVTVGGGGSGSVGRGSGTNGSNSSVGLAGTAIGGGRGGGHANNGGSNQPNTGGSGGGASYSTQGAAGTSGQGNSGGSGAVYLNLPVAKDSGGGGGGAGGAGANGQGSNGGGGAGGVGTLSDISGTPTYYAGGGAGATNDMNTRAIGGLGGGGNGGTPAEKNGDNGGINTGSGGGGGNGGGGNSGAGGSGIVIIRYKGPVKATGGTITSVGGYTIHTFTSSGTFARTNKWYDLSGNENHVSMNNSVMNSVWSNGAFALNGSYGFTSTDPPTREQYCTVVMVYKTLDTQELWVRGQTGSYYIAASNNNNYYDERSGDPAYYVDTLATTNPNTPIEYKDNEYHMWEAKRVDFSDWTTMNWFLYGGAWNLTGTVKKIMVYNRSLTAAESLQNYNALKSRF